MEAYKRKAKPLLVAVCVLLLVVWGWKRYQEDYTQIVIPRKVPQLMSGRNIKIPRVVVRSFASPVVGGIFRDAVFSCIDLNPDYQHVFLTDEDCAQFMYREFPGRVSAAYDKLIPGAYKSDLWRMCYLYKYGGVYLDLNKTLLKPFRFVINGNYDLVTVIDLPAFRERPSCCVWQGFVACRPGLPVLDLCIRRSVENIENEYYGYNSLDITGPMMMGRVFRDYYGECVNRPGVYRKRGELIKLLYHAGDYHKDEFENRIIHLNNNIRSRMNDAWKSQTSLPHYGELYNTRRVYKTTA